MIINRAFVRETLHTCGAVGVVLLAIFVVARSVKFLRQAVEGDIPPDAVALLLALKTVAYLDILIPLVLYVATLLVLARWMRDRELVVINACGIGVAQLLKPAFVLVATVGAVGAVFSFYLSPLSLAASSVVTDELRARAGVTGVTPGVFGEVRGGVYFVESFDSASGAFKNIFIHHGGDNTTVVADTGSVSGAGDGVTGVTDGADDEFLVLQNGKRYRVGDDDDKYVVLEFETYGLRINQRAGDGGGLPLKATPTTALFADDTDAAAAELHWRVAKVVMLPVLMVFALAFASGTGGGRGAKRFPGMLPALLVYLAYSNLLGLGVALVGRGAPPVLLSAVHLAFAAAAVWLLHRRNANMPLLPSYIN